MNPIFLIGYMAAGKTTLGRALARKLNLPFIDLDFYIEQRFHTTVKHIFADKGEEAFRKIENSLLHEAGEFEDVIISCGGGTPCFFDNMDYMLRRGKVVWLQADTECIARRVMARPDKRPLLAGLEPDALRKKIDDGLSRRIHFYSRAHIAFDSSRLENKHQIAEAVDAIIPILFPQG